MLCAKLYLWASQRQDIVIYCKILASIVTFSSLVVINCLTNNVREPALRYWSSNNLQFVSAAGRHEVNYSAMYISFVILCSAIISRNLFSKRAPAASQANDQPFDANSFFPFSLLLGEVSCNGFSV